MKIYINKTQNKEKIVEAQQHLKNLKMDLYYYEKDENRKIEIEKQFKLCLLYYILYNLYYNEKIRKKNKNEKNKNTFKIING